MKIKCIKNTGTSLPNELINKETGLTKESEFHIKINKVYNVYAIVVYFGYPWYFICTNPYKRYPFWYPAPLFSVEDSKLSKYWIYAPSIENYNDDIKALIAYPEWANFPYHYDYIVEGETEEEIEHQELFQKYRQLMDLEFPDLEIALKASSLDKGWAMCPICIDAWEPHSKDGMIICPTCKNVMHNPFYESIKPLIID